MSGHLTEDEWRRIYEFANASAYERAPEMLLPDPERRSDDARDGSPETESR
jgi:hypothetical protein